MSNERQQRAARAEQMRKEREKADRKQRNVITIAIVTVVVVLVGVGGYAIKSASDDNKKNTDLVYPANTDKKTFGFDYTAADAGGTPAAAETKDPVVVTVTEDFQCPACLSFEQQSGAFLDDLVKKGEIVVNYRPISFLDRSSANEYSSRAANAALCVLDKGGVEDYKKFHDLLYANQPAETTAGPEDDQLIKDAASVGVTGIDSCVNKKTYGPWLEESLKFAQDDGFKGTPWVRIGGKDVESPNPQSLQAAIDAAKKA